MKAAEIMTTDVLSVGPDTPIRTVARLLSAGGISAAPVIDTFGAPIGMISEGDLMGRDEADRQARRDWWLNLLAEGEELNPGFVATLRDPDRTAREVMTTPVITIDEDMDVTKVADLLVTHRIKRVPVVRDDRVVGIVSRADLMRALIAKEARTSRPALKTAGMHGAGMWG